MSQIEPETWSEILGFCSYSVSTQGRIRNEKTGRFLKPTVNMKGYMTVSLWENNVKKIYFVHRLVAAAFIPNPEHKGTVNHINHVRQDNSVDNLEWATTAEQNNHKQKHIGSSRRQKAIWQCNMQSGERLKIYNSIDEAAKAVKGHHANISSVANKRRSCAYGYKWEYDRKEDTLGEIWKDVNPGLVGGAEGFRLSTEGRLETPKARILLPFPDSGGEASYHCLCINGKVMFAHVLMARVFLPNFFGKNMVNHKNGVKSDYRLWNLQWVTARENVQHAVNLGIFGKKLAVQQLDDTQQIVKTYNNASEAATATGQHVSNLHQAIKKGHRGAGYFWKFVDTQELNTTPHLLQRVV